MASLAARGISGGATGGVILVEDLDQQRLPARCLAAVLRGAGIPARLVPFAGAVDTEAVVEEARRRGASLVVISQLFSHLLAEHLALARELRRAEPGVHTAMVGPLPSLAWRELLDICPDLDSVLCGEAEQAIVDLLRATALGAGWQDVPGLAWRRPAVVRNSPVPRIADLDGLPAPVYDGPLPGAGAVRFATVESSRGCYHRCAFCLPTAALRQTGQAYRMRSVRGIGQELEARIQAGARLFLFDDEQFLASGPRRERRVNELEQELTRRDLEIAFTIKCRADDVALELFAQLRRMGLLRVYLGLESTWQPCLDLLGKRTTVAQNAGALRVLKTLGIVADFRCLLFHPWSTLESIRAELAGLAAVESELNTLLDFREVEVYPGTPMAARLAGEGRPASPLAPSVYVTGDPAAELLRRLCRLVFGASGRYEAARERVTQGWFKALFWERFGGDHPLATRGDLEAEVRQINQTCLALWDEMVDFAVAADVTKADGVNARAAEWCARLSLACLPPESLRGATWDRGENLAV